VQHLSEERQLVAERPLSVQLLRDAAQPVAVRRHAVSHLLVAERLLVAASHLLVAERLLVAASHLQSAAAQLVAAPLVAVQHADAPQSAAPLSAEELLVAVPVQVFSV